MNVLHTLLLATGTAAILTCGVMRHALRRGVLDRPNARSSHTRPTPRGGGLAIVVTTLAGALVCLIAYGSASTSLVLVIGGAFIIAVVGYVDDRRPLSARIRCLVQFTVAIVCVYGLVRDGVFALMMPSFPPLVAGTLTVVAIVWSINLYNFMDGIDGIAASQALFVALASLMLIGADGGLFNQLLAVTAGAFLGFLLWNWPPAKIFMGDVGSGFIGFWIAALAIVLHMEQKVTIWTSVILSSLFVSDATTTLVRRVLSGKKWSEAHRSHAYQRWSRRWNSHARTTLAVCAINVAVVLPLALLARQWSHAAPVMALGTVALFCAVAYALGAGRDESRA